MAEVCYPMFHISVTCCILHDPMHIILEEINRLGVRLLLTHLIQERYFIFGDLGNVIDVFNSSSLHARDKPQRTEARDLHEGSNLRQTAASMKNLVPLLPFMVGHWMPESDLHWKHFIQLQQMKILAFNQWHLNRRTALLSS